MGQIQSHVKPLMNSGQGCLLEDGNNLPIILFCINVGKMNRSIIHQGCHEIVATKFFLDFLRASPPRSLMVVPLGQNEGTTTQIEM